ncbi:hypothetical protein HNY73_017771 [Argiope bruennichi]|uniref:Uncharacterized protein n=1 Tax=Argiope bruennichi TaxID=94029 RepID=A0A8T0EES8_ARGBR|nr:hypothetical protein HNY73_017771 [Argiope bruennichi]
MTNQQHADVTLKDAQGVVVVEYIEVRIALIIIIRCPPKMKKLIRLDVAPMKRTDNQLNKQSLFLTSTRSMERGVSFRG